MTRNIVFFSLVIAACTPPAKHETAAVSAAVDRFRRGEDDAKAQLATAAAAVPCTDAAVCAAKSTCVAAMEPMARALTLKGEVARKLDDIEHGRLSAGSPEARGLADKLDEAERLLEDSRAKWAACEKSLTELRMTYGS
jgi:hypothetical protein